MFLLVFSSTGGGGRTRTWNYPYRILNPARLPFRHSGDTCWYCELRRARRLIEDDSDRKFPASFTTQEFECETRNRDWLNRNMRIREVHPAASDVPIASVSPWPCTLLPAEFVRSVVLLGKNRRSKSHGGFRYGLITPTACCPASVD